MLARETDVRARGEPGRVGVFARRERPRARRVRDLVDRDAHVGLHRAEDDLDASLRDAGLLARDLDERRAEPVGVIEGDARDCCRAWRRNDVRRVEASAEPDLEDGDVDVRFAEGDERGERERLEEAEVGRAIEDAAHERRERRVVERRAVDANALGETAQVRRRVEAGPLSGRARDPLDHRAGRSFAVGPRDVHRFERTFRVPEPNACILHRLQAEAHSERNACVQIDEGAGERRGGHRAPSSYDEGGSESPRVGVR